MLGFMILLIRLVIEKLFWLLIEIFFIHKVFQIKFLRASKIVLTFVVALALISYLYNPVEVWLDFFLRTSLSKLGIVRMSQNSLITLFDLGVDLIIGLFLRIILLEKLFKIKVGKGEQVKLLIFYTFIIVIIPIIEIIRFFGGIKILIH